VHQIPPLLEHGNGLTVSTAAKKPDPGIPWSASKAVHAAAAAPDYRGQTFFGCQTMSNPHSISQQLYDVVFFGTDIERSRLRETAEHVAEILGTTADTVEGLLREPGSVLVMGVTAEEARNWQTYFLGQGVRCNYRPTAHSDAHLELASDANILQSATCPACGHLNEAKPGNPAPSTCEACGVVFRKFREVRLKKLERAQIKYRLTEKHRDDLKKLDELEQREDEKKRRLRMEWEIRRELGLPRFVTNRLRMFGSLLVVFAFGLASGAAAAVIVGFAKGYCSLESRTVAPGAVSNQPVRPADLPAPSAPKAQKKR
jgi:hypothetical protein